MLKWIITLTLYLLSSSLIFGQDYAQGFNDGWRTAWSNNPGSGISPTPTIAPMPGLGGNDYQHGFAAGAQAAQQSITHGIASGSSHNIYPSSGLTLGAVPQYNPQPAQQFVRDPNAVLNGFQQGMNVAQNVLTQPSQTQARIAQANLATAQAQSQIDAIQERAATQKAQLEQITGDYNAKSAAIEEQSRKLDLDYATFNDLLEAVKKRNPDAELTLGKALESGSLADIKDKKMGQQFIQMAADDGQPKAQVMMGVRLIEGKEITKDTKRGSQYLMSAMSKGEWDAAAVMGIALMQGQIGEKDPVGAYMFFNIGSIKGNATCQKCRLLEEGAESPETIIKGMEATVNYFKNNFPALNSTTPPK